METLFNVADFVPELREQFEERPMNPKAFLRPALPIKNPEEHPGPVPTDFDRRSLSLSDGKDLWFWEADSLRALFRGDRQPPVLGDYPEAYNEVFLILEMHVLEVSKLLGDPRDAEMKEIYSVLRRRPDGQSLGFFHDCMWQAAALVLGTRPLSQAEFEAIIARLERSCRTFERGPTSRNYLTSLRMTVGQAGGY